MAERITVEEIAQINKAMEAVQGNRAAAAEIVGIEKSRLDRAIITTPALTARWKTTEALADGEVVINPVTTINRTPPVPLGLSSADRMAIELSTGEKKINKSLAKLGFKQAEITAISSIEEFAGQHFQETLSIMHGGLLKSAMRLMLLAERIEQTYLQDDNLEEKERDWWWSRYFQILENLRGMNEQTNKAALTKAIIEIKKKEGGGLGKPGFSPHTTTAIQINVPANSQVKTNDPTNVSSRQP